MPNFPYRGVNAGVAIEERPFSPDSLQDLFASNQLTGLFGEQEEQIERSALQVNDLAAAAEFAGAAVQLEIFESQHSTRQLHLPQEQAKCNSGTLLRIAANLQQTFRTSSVVHHWQACRST